MPPTEGLRAVRAPLLAGNLRLLPRHWRFLAPAGQGSHRAAEAHTATSAHHDVRTATHWEEPDVSTHLGRDRSSGRTRWRTFALVLAPAALVAGAVLALMMRGAVTASFAFAGQDAKISATRLQGTGFTQFTTVTTDAAGRTRPVLVSAFREATLSDFCQSIRLTSPFGPVTLRLTAGGGGVPVRAENLIVDLAQVRSDAKFTGFQSGVDAARLSGPIAGTTGAFSQQSEAVVITGLKQQASATSAGTFTLNGLALSAFSASECF
jgi:hypothetical protein